MYLSLTHECVLIKLVNVALPCGCEGSVVQAMDLELSVPSISLHFKL